MRRTGLTIVGALALMVIAMTAGATELVQLSPGSWDRYAPKGKEVDAIYGDYVLTNGQVTAVIAAPLPLRNANMMVRDVEGMIIDLTAHRPMSDQMQAYWAAEANRQYQLAGVETFGGTEVYDTSTAGEMTVHAKGITIKFVATPDPDGPEIELRYTLEDGAESIEVETIYLNDEQVDRTVRLRDIFRAERTFEKVKNGVHDMFWVSDRHFGQAYGIMGSSFAIGDGERQDVAIETRSESRLTALFFQVEEGDEDPDQVVLEPGQSCRLTRRVIPGADLTTVRGIACQIAEIAVAPMQLSVKDPKGRPVRRAEVRILEGETLIADGQTDVNGILKGSLPVGNYQVIVTVDGCLEARASCDLNSGESFEVTTPALGLVRARITDSEGGPIPCKVQFLGQGETPSPNYGPDTGTFGVANIRYSQNGRFLQRIAPGQYQVIVSYGPEYDAIFTELEVPENGRADLLGKLIRSVETTGWLSADFHSHSSPSGDNSSSQLGRVLNLLCEHLEFAPCTEHNRLSSYVPHLERLDVARLMATCTGMELTSIPGTINHQNSFPLVLKPHLQDGGAPPIDLDPEMQVERLAIWDNRSEKVIQLNHPDLGQVFFDRNGDGKADEGFSGMFSALDSIEVHPPHLIFEPAVVDGRNNDVFNWMQLINQGFRYTGVVNTDAHYNEHGSGFLRNYVQSSTDDPAEADIAELVDSVQEGRLVMSNGPFLEAIIANGSDKTAISGQDLDVSGGPALLKIRVQCPNWFDIDRVQVLLNGRPDAELTWTRADDTQGLFSDETVCFEHQLKLSPQSDTHVIVATIGQNSQLGPVIGPAHAEDRPVAVTNPIFLDVDGNGFQPNGDTLGADLPIKRR